MSVVNTVPQPTSDNYTFREEYTQIIDKKIEILAAACLFAAGVYFAGVCSIGFSCCILLAGSFPCIAELGIEAIHGHEPISVAAAPIPTPVEEVPILSPEEIESRIESARASLETTLENEVLTPQLINDKLTFWIQLPGAREYLSNLDRMNVSNERQALHFKTWLTSHSSEIRELELQLPNNVQLPREIGLLTNLQFLSIAGGGQQLPDEIALLRNLRGLRFRDSILTQVPQQIQLLRNLTSLSLYIDNLSIIPEYLFDFGNLRAIELSGLFSEIPLGILRLTNLTTLGIINSNLREIPSWLTSLNNLRTLDLTRNKIDILPQDYPFPNSLEILSLSDNNLRAPPSWEIPEESRLVEIHLSENLLLNWPTENPMPQFTGHYGRYGFNYFDLPSWLYPPHLQTRSL